MSTSLTPLRSSRPSRVTTPEEATAAVSDIQRFYRIHRTNKLRKEIEAEFKEYEAKNIIPSESSRLYVLDHKNTRAILSQVDAHLNRPAQQQSLASLRENELWSHILTVPTLNDERPLDLLNAAYHRKRIDNIKKTAIDWLYSIRAKRFAEFIDENTGIGMDIAKKIGNFMRLV